MDRVCCICLTETGAVSCASGHSTCVGCLSRHARTCCDLRSQGAQQSLLARRGVVPCPFADIEGQHAVACSQALRVSTLATALPAEDIDDVIVPAIEWQAEKRGHAAASGWMLQGVSKAKQEHRAAEEMLCAALPEAYQCGRCGFGPILHRNCDDLHAHHRQRVGNGTRLSNDCPRCGWFARSIKQWPRWNGRLPGEWDPTRGTCERALRGTLWRGLALATRLGHRAVGVALIVATCALAAARCVAMVVGRTIGLAASCTFAIARCVRTIIICMARLVLNFTWSCRRAPLLAVIVDVEMGVAP